MPGLFAVNLNIIRLSRPLRRSLPLRLSIMQSMGEPQTPLFYPVADAVDGFPLLVAIADA